MSVYGDGVLRFPNLQGFWTLGETSGTTFADSSGNGLTATIGGTVTLNQSGIVPGDSTKAALFNGTTGYASLASGALNFERTDKFAVEALFNLTSIGAGQEHCIVGKLDGSGIFRGWALLVSGTGAGTGQLVAYLISDNGANNRLIMSGSQTISQGVNTHVVFTYNGTSAASGCSFAVNGVVDNAPSTVVANLSATIQTSTVATIGASGGTGATRTFFNGKMQYVAVYGASGPGSTSLQGGYTNTQPYNLRAHWGYSAGILGIAPPTYTATPNVIIDTDMSADVDDVFDVHQACYLHAQGFFNLIGVTVTSGNTDSASTTQAILDFWNNPAPVYAYQAGGLPSTSIYTTATALQFLPDDATNTGCTAVATIPTAGTAYVVGDVLTVPGGTIYSGARGRATTLTVSGVSAGGITALTISDSGSYSTAPSGTITLPNPHGGTAAQVTLTYTARRGNYTNALTGIRKLLNDNSNVVILALGFAKTLADLAASASNAGGDGYASGQTLITNKVAALVLVAGFGPGNALWGVSAEWNITQDIANFQALVSGGNKWPGPIIESGIELADPENDGVTGLVDIKPSAGLDPNTNPMKYAWDEWVSNGGTVDGAGKRIWYSAAGLFYCKEGVTSELYWGTIGGTESIDGSGNNSLSSTAGAPPWSFLRKAGTDASWVTTGEDWLNQTPAAYELDALPLTYQYAPQAVDFVYTPASTAGADSHDAIERRTRRQRALDAAQRRADEQWQINRNALRLALEAAMGMAAEVVEDAPADVAAEVQQAAQEARKAVPAPATPVVDLAPAQAALGRLQAAVEAAARAKALADDDEEVLMLLRALQ